MNNNEKTCDMIMSCNASFYTRWKCSNCGYEVDIDQCDDDLIECPECHLEISGFFIEESELPF